jgi:hypothetical protein
VDQSLVISNASRSHSDTPHSVGLLWTSDQPDAETSAWQHSQQTDMQAPRVGFELTSPESERPQTHPLDRAATGTGMQIYYTYKIYNQLVPERFSSVN